MLYVIKASYLLVFYFFHLGFELETKKLNLRWPVTPILLK
ncbi:hypothetical protein PCARR_a0905 [Pseudoalteromonas carrageenovora IAM 12662]|uniref:Uncharacterized protein n=1 Tax=Pseudoalteromonas carrageenovora IAM 12662 TaxID=1314868 RepID=A0ABR9EQ67_PSEVC|nr:hypothetical protein [Pseudoalteromonas carrageenovora IAM 12662]